MKHITLVLIISSLLGCVHQSKIDESPTEGGGEIDSSSVLYCSDYGDEYFHPMSYSGGITFRGFGSAWINGEHKMLKPYMLIYSVNGLDSMLLLFFHEFDTITNVLNSRTVFSKIPLAVGRYSNAALFYHPNDTTGNFKYGLWHERQIGGGTELQGNYPYKDNTPNYSHLEITDIDKSRRVICGNFRMRAEIKLPTCLLISHA